METKTPLTPSKPTKNQVGKVRERLMAAARKSGIPLAQFQVALDFPGTGLEDELAALFVKYAKKAWGIVTPVAAKDTGLVPEGWEVKKDCLEGDVDLAKLDYSFCPHHENEVYISSMTMLKEAAEVGAIGSLGFAAALLEAQNEGKEIFPVESRDKHHFIMPLTELHPVGGATRIPAFSWRGWGWVLVFDCFGDDISRRARFVCRSE